MFGSYRSEVIQREERRNENRALESIPVSRDVGIKHAVYMQIAIINYRSQPWLSENTGKFEENVRAASEPAVSFSL